MTRPVHLLVTGYARSGLTLVNRLLDAHPQVSVADRTQFDRLTSVMRRCGAARARSTPGDPFGALFDEPGCEVERVTELFLDARGVDGGDGPELAEVLREASDTRARSVHKPAALVRGLREHFCEVLTPYLLERGFHVLFVLRDPLDLVASARMGDRGIKTNTGWALSSRVRVLDMVRQWRKSVALAVLTARHRRARTLRYERLVTRPATWTALCRWLCVDAVSPEVLQAGWSGNSSFGPLRALSPEPIGRGALLPPAVAAFVRAATAPERRLLGYETGRPALVPYTSEAEIDPDHAPDPETAAAESRREARRREQLAQAAVEPAEACRWFLHAEVHRRLHRTWRSGSDTGETRRM